MRASGHVWLVGMPGVGKTTIGRLLAARLQMRFVDLDERIESGAQKSVAEIFAEGGAEVFREREAAAVRELAKDDESTIIATGGGAPCFGVSLAAMQQSGLVVWITAPPDEVFDDLDVSSRPLLASADDPRDRWLRLAEERRDTYAQATVTVERSGREPAALVDEIAGWLADHGDAHLGGATPPALWVELDERRYPILFDEAPGAPARFAACLARHAPPGRTALGVVTDETVGRLHAGAWIAALQQRGYAVTRVVVPDGENSKSMARAAEVAERLAAGGLERRGLIVALGGGVVGDLAGFVAAILFRGIEYVQVPTTLLAMVDSSVGGKTGVNLPSGKNLAGAFYQPSLVYVALELVRTLPARDLSAGLAEALKHALLQGGEAWRRAPELAGAARAGEAAALSRLVADSCRYKAGVVAGDEREQTPDGGRALLNLGHTVGHALESHSHRSPRAGEGPLRHGEAVALGLLAAARVGKRSLGGGDSRSDLEASLTTLFARLGLPTDLDARLADPLALADLAVDKKRVAGRIRYVALSQPGDARITHLLPAELVALLQPATPSLDTAPEAAP